MAIRKSKKNTTPSEAVESQVGSEEVIAENDEAQDSISAMSSESAEQVSGESFQLHEDNVSLGDEDAVDAGETEPAAQGTDATRDSQELPDEVEPGSEPEPVFDSPEDSSQESHPEPGDEKVHVEQTSEDLDPSGLAGDEPVETVMAASPEGEGQPLQRAGFLARIVAWFKRKFSRKRSVEDGPVGPHAQPVFDEKWANKTRLELKELSSVSHSSEIRAQELQQELSELEQEQVRVESWMESLQRSYYWKLERKMDQGLEQARSDIAEYEGLVKALELPEKGTLLNLRRKFHKGLSVNFVTFFVPTFLLFFIPWFSRVDLVGWLVNLLRSPIYILLIVTLGAVVAGLFLLLRKVLGKKQMPFKRAAKWSLISMSLPLIVLALFRFKEFLFTFVTPVIEQVRPTTLWVLAILFVFLTLALLIIYYQGWSVFRRTVTDELARLENVVSGYVKTRQELGRLEFLYGQSKDWLKLLAHNLYRPWKVHPDWKSENQVQAVSESFQMALRVAQAVENDASEAATLRRKIANRLLVQGWRSEAFEMTLSEIGKHLGYEGDKVNADLLDADLPHQPNNSRQLVLEYFDHSAGTSRLGTLDLTGVPESNDIRSRPSPDDRYLVEVARDQLSYLVGQSQNISLSEARPSVQQVVKNPLMDLAGSNALDEMVEISEWDDFLAEGLGIADPVQPPLGILAFTDEGKKSGAPGSVVSKVLVPDRMADSLPKPQADNLEVVALPADSDNQPAEVLVRFDVVGPVPFGYVTLIQNSLVSGPAQPDEEVNDDL